jgi:hypothetical protein
MTKRRSNNAVVKAWRMHLYRYLGYISLKAEKTADKAWRMHLPDICFACVDRPNVGHTVLLANVNVVGALSRPRVLLIGFVNRCFS